MWLLKEDQITSLESDGQLLKKYMLEQKLIIVHYA